ncbi:hypothetical protein [Hymenobacter arizonensis]|uniref:Uncharacterized protein n=1 Tax=Hymenobacter arizonensis TaxID=1227077 RepID=A0A1I5TZS3_HYMAR|nr:hypothetical protein [Hymenobacter arizonensis]SFP88509.1 hypothetical protein SAMN04515668_0684 [Hymenobacter arizonensis]
MNEDDQKFIDSTLERVRSLHNNISNMWDAEAVAAFYYSVLTSTIARNGPEVSRPLLDVLAQVYESTAKSHVDLGRLTTGLNFGKEDQALSAQQEAE